MCPKCVPGEGSGIGPARPARAQAVSQARLKLLIGCPFRWKSHGTICLLESPRPLQLPFQDCAKLRREAEHPALPIIRVVSTIGRKNAILHAR